jgi:putative sigma-54 modulation protein
MKTEIRGVHLEITERIETYVQKKIARLEFAKDTLTDVLITLVKDKNLFKIESTLNFRWGHSDHVELQNYDLDKGIDALFDKLEEKIKREKSKVQEHHRKEPVVPETTKEP